MKNKKLAYLYIAIVVFLTGCGGGGGGGASDTSAPQTLTGTVAKGSPLVKYRVFVSSVPELAAANGGIGVSSVEVDANGNYTYNLGGRKPPYVIYAAPSDIRDRDSNFPRLYSFALKAGTANVTPFTDLLFQKLINRPLKDSVVDWSIDYSALSRVTQSTIDSARMEVLDYLLHRPSKYLQSMLMPVDASAIGDFVTTKFQASPNDPYDAALESLQETLSGQEDIFAIELNMLDRNISALDINNPSISNFSSFTFLCEFGLCGISNNGQIAPLNAPNAYFSKYALIKSLASQFDQHGIVRLNCSNAIQNTGILAGANNFYMSGSLLQINDLSANSYSVNLLSGYRTMMSLAASSGQNYMRYIDISSYSYSAVMQFDALGLVSLSLSLNNVGYSTCTR